MLSLLSMVTLVMLPARGLCNGIIVMRHGEAESNVLQVYNADPKNKNYHPVHLTELGKSQVTTSARALRAKGISGENIRAVYVSPLPRTRETAQIVASILNIPAKKIHVSELLTEVNMGKYEGVKYSEFPSNSLDHSSAHAYGGETDADVRTRVKALIDPILLECNKDSNVLIITHHTPVRQTSDYLSGIDVTTGVPSPDSIKTGSYIEISWDKIYSIKNIPTCGHASLDEK